MLYNLLEYVESYRDNLLRGMTFMLDLKLYDEKPRHMSRASFTKERVILDIPYSRRTFKWLKVLETIFYVVGNPVVTFCTYLLL